jgi:hypothetical protein
MNSTLRGSHKIVTLQLPGRSPAVFLCMTQQDADGGDASYVMAENDGSPLRWKNCIRGNAARRLRNEFRDRIVGESKVDDLDAAMILLCATEKVNNV